MKRIKKARLEVKYEHIRRLEVADLNRALGGARITSYILCQTQGNTECGPSWCYDCAVPQ